MRAHARRRGRTGGRIGGRRCCWRRVANGHFGETAKTAYERCACTARAIGLGEGVGRRGEVARGPARRGPVKINSFSSTYGAGGIAEAEIRRGAAAGERAERVFETP